MPAPDRSSVPAPPSPAAGELLTAAHRVLTTAALATTPADRYAAAHLSALRTAAAVLATRAIPRRGSRNAWVLLARIAPELAEWAGFFAASAARRAAVEAGRPGVVGSRDADDLLRAAETFLVLVEGILLRRGVITAGRGGLPSTTVAALAG